ncbi:MAG: hypothetical protein LBN23_02620 [Paludibacter sp.]|jgi:hypothetical protein|nr:hypothetical protein [Paludibacter sp.]
MKRKIIVIVLLSVVIQVFSSCSSMYIASVKNIPLFDKKNEGQIEAGISTNSIYATGSYAVTDEYALAVNGSLSYGNFSDRYDIFTKKNAPYPSGFFTIAPPKGDFNHKYIEASFGKYNLLFPQKISSRMKLEVFAGCGYGIVDDILEYVGTGLWNINYYTPFVQCNFGTRYRYLDAGVAMRTAYSFFDYTYTNNEYPNENEHYKFNTIHLEPLFRVGLGRGKLKLNFRLGFNFRWILDKEIAAKDFFNTPMHLSIGAGYRF